MNFFRVIVFLLSIHCSVLSLANDTPCGEDVEGHVHNNGGGFVANTAEVEDTVYIGPDAAVCDHAEVYDYAEVTGYATRVFGNAWVFGSARVSGNAWVYDRIIDER